MRPDFTKLEAVNLMLRAVGEQPVNTLDSNGINDTDSAQSILDEKIIEVLAEGHVFNTEIRTYTPDDSGDIAVPRNVLRVDGANNDYYSKLETRGNRLYDLENTTFTFTTTVDLDVVWWVEFTDIPIPLRMSIAAKAARIYQQDSLNDPQKDRLLQEREIKSQVVANRAEALNADFQWGNSSNSSSTVYTKPPWS